MRTSPAHLAFTGCPCSIYQSCLCPEGCFHAFLWLLETPLKARSISNLTVTEPSCSPILSLEIYRDHKRLVGNPLASAFGLQSVSFRRPSATEDHLDTCFLCFLGLGSYSQPSHPAPGPQAWEWGSLIRRNKNCASSPIFFPFLLSHRLWALAARPWLCCSLHHSHPPILLHGNNLSWAICNCGPQARGGSDTPGQIGWLSGTCVGTIKKLPFQGTVLGILPSLTFLSSCLYSRGLAPAGDISQAPWLPFPLGQANWRHWGRLPKSRERPE